MKVTVDDVVKALNVYEVSARELLDSTIPFEVHELVKLAEYKGITLDELINMLK